MPEHTMKRKWCLRIENRETAARKELCERRETGSKPVSARLCELFARRLRLEFLDSDYSRPWKEKKRMQRTKWRKWRQISLKVQRVIFLLAQDYKMFVGGKGDVCVQSWTQSEGLAREFLQRKRGGKEKVMEREREREERIENTVRRGWWGWGGFAAGCCSQ